MEITDIKKNSDGDFYDTFENFKAAVSDFFVNAPSGGANDDPLDGVVINLEPGQYLSDVVQTITGATLENPVTINFYNHSKTVNWETFTGKNSIARASEFCWKLTCGQIYIAHEWV